MTRPNGRPGGGTRVGGSVVTIVGAPSSIGIRPYDDGERARQLDRAPGVLRELGVVQRLAAHDLGDVPSSAYRDFIRPPGGVRNETEVADYCRSLADQVDRAMGNDRFALVLGGDCSIVLGCLLGVRRHAGRVGLAYIDGHADFGTPAESLTGSAASMCLAMAVGRGDSFLSRLAGPEPLVQPEDVVLIGRRDAGQTYYGHAALADSGILDLPNAAVSERGGEAVALAALERLACDDLVGFWIHVDADVINPAVMPAVDSPEPGGPDIAELGALVAPLVRHPAALGMELTIYDPALDEDRACGARLVAFLEAVLGRDA